MFQFGGLSPQKPPRGNGTGIAVHIHTHYSIISQIFLRVLASGLLSAKFPTWLKLLVRSLHLIKAKVILQIRAMCRASRNIIQ